MTKKDRTIKAIKKMIKNYRKKERENRCPLCEIHRNRDWKCKGCPMADQYSNPGCAHFNSYINMFSDIDHRFPREWLRRNFPDRADFHEHYLLPIVEKLPPEQFTKKGWKYLDLDWEK